MKRNVALYAIIWLVLLCAPAYAATHLENGETIAFDGRVLRIYDIVVFESMKAEQTYRSAMIAAHRLPADVLPGVVRGLLLDEAQGLVYDVDIAGLDVFLGADEADALAQAGLQDKLQALLGAMEPLSQFQQAQALSDDEGSASPRLIMQENMRSGSGYFLERGERLPFVRVTFRYTYAQQGAYAFLPERQRVYYENYTFAYTRHGADAQPSWGLYSIIRYSPAFFNMI